MLGLTRPLAIFQQGRKRTDGIPAKHRPRLIEHLAARLLEVLSRREIFRQFLLRLCEILPVRSLDLVEPGLTPCLIFTDDWILHRVPPSFFLGDLLKST